MSSMNLTEQVTWLFVLAIPIACIAWTFTHEEVFREIHEFCVKKNKTSINLLTRKFYYLLTCEYCFSHYVTIIMLAITRYTLLIGDWRGYIIAGFSLVWIANLYMSLYSFLRTDLKKERLITEHEEKELRKP